MQFEMGPFQFVDVDLQTNVQISADGWLSVSWWTEVTDEDWPLKVDTFCSCSDTRAV